MSATSKHNLAQLAEAETNFEISKFKAGDVWVGIFGCNNLQLNEFVKGFLAVTLKNEPHWLKVDEKRDCHHF